MLFNSYKITKILFHLVAFSRERKMQANNVLLALVLAVILSNICATKHHKSAGQHSRIHNHEDDDFESKHEHREKRSSHHHEKPHVVKRQGGESSTSTTRTTGSQDTTTGSQEGTTGSQEGTTGSQEGTTGSQEGTTGSQGTTTGSEDSTDTPSAPAQPAPPLSIPDLHLDVGKVKIKSQTESCNGVLLEPTFVLTSASCVYPNHTAEPHENITFDMGTESKPVKKVFRNPYWHLTGERKENFALLQLQQPMAHQNQKYLSSMAWSSYALEDLGDSYVGDPDPSSCDTASKTARSGEVIRHVSDQLITLSCSNKGTFATGSPIFRLVDNVPVIYGVYIGHCTTGSLDRAISGSCGARISKQVFLDFCQQAAKENVELTACDSELLDRTNVDFPTTVFSRETYDAMTERNHNPKDVLLAYHSSASKHYQDFVEDMETVQRLKSVYDKFQFAVVDVNILPIQVKAVPFIEYRTKSSDAFISYNDPYDSSNFRKFMDTFGRVGAPPSGSISFLQNLHLEKRSDVPGTSRQGVGGAENDMLTVKSSSLPQTAGEMFIPQGTTCHATGGYYLVSDKKCTCLPTHFGSGEACEVLTTVLQTNCEYNVNGQNKKYQNVKTETGEKIWCNEKKSIEATVTATSDVSGKTLTSDDCADAIVDLIACSSDNNLQILHDIPSNSSIKRSEIQRRSPVNTKSGNPPESYLSNFEGNSPPGPITNAPNTHYFTVAGEAAEAGATPYSVLFDGNRGDPVMLAYKLIKANMQGIDINKRLLRNRRTKLDTSYVRMGSNLIYLKRGNTTSPEAVVEGQLNPNLIHSYNDKAMDLTFNHLNGFPQYSATANGVWRKYEEKMALYAKDRCSAKDDSAMFYAVSGLSDYELTGKGSSAFLKPAMYWPVAYEGAIPQPYHSPELTDGLAKSIIMPKSVWTVGCCTWTDNGEPKAESISFWANNKPRGVPKHENQPDLHTLGARLFPGKPCFQFFPANPQCNIADNHFTIAP